MAKQVTSPNVLWLKALLSIAGLIGMISLFCWAHSNGKNENLELKNNGISTKAVIYKVSKGPKGRYVFDYHFYPNGFKQEGYSSSLRKRYVGDTITIMYLPNDYTVNKPVFNIR